MNNQTKMFLNVLTVFKIEEKNCLRLKNTFNLSDLEIENIQNSAKVAKLYIKIKGAKECRLLGFKNKKELTNFIIDNSDKFNWVFKSTKNIRSFHRKIKRYKTENEKSEYLGLLSFINKNFFNQNAKKITDEELNLIKELKEKDPKISAVKIQKELNSELGNTNISISCIRNYIREFELEQFKELIE
ncbi:MAG: hypothetical protein CR965_02195 [Paludibacter sp.]|nr:MAG: hypothetical protein CR965_02195 [Paludibacter sp.]